MTAQTMTIKEFLNGNVEESQTLTLLEEQQWELMKLTCKALLIVSAAILPLNLDSILDITNGTLETYLNQFTGNGIEAYISK